MAPNSLFSYVGPETMMPVASVAATMIGFLLIGWRSIAVLAMKCVRRVLGNNTADDLDAGPAVVELAMFREAAVVPVERREMAAQRAA
jgi:hypothetical protein